MLYEALAPFGGITDFAEILNRERLAGVLERLQPVALVRCCWAVG